MLQIMDVVFTILSSVCNSALQIVGSNDLLTWKSYYATGNASIVYSG